MLTEERKQKILALLEEDGIVKLHPLIALLDTSESTVRRDLQELEDAGLLERIHGGAKKLTALGFEPKMQDKEQLHASEKKMIARYAASLVKEGDVIYLDAGSSTLALIGELPQNLKIKVVTNSVKHAARLIDAQIETIIIGGTIKLSTNATFGSDSLQQLGQYQFNRAFLGTNGIDLTAGLTTPDPEEAILKRTAIENSGAAYVLADHTKFGQKSFVKVAPLGSTTIITDFCPAEELAAYQAQTTIKEVK